MRERERKENEDNRLAIISLSSLSSMAKSICHLLFGIPSVVLHQWSIVFRFSVSLLLSQIERSSSSRGLHHMQTRWQSASISLDYLSLRVCWCTERVSNHHQKKEKRRERERRKELLLDWFLLLLLLFFSFVYIWLSAGALNSQTWYHYFPFSSPLLSR